MPVMCVRPSGTSEISGPGRYVWSLEHVVSLGNPIPCRGMLGLWAIPDDVRERIPL